MKRVDSAGSLVMTAMEDSVKASSSPQMSSHHSRKFRREPTMYHPVISSIVRPNTLKNCVEVREMMAVCAMNAQHDDVFMCQTAKRYNEYCNQK
eukprot:CAMPEP_0198153258 /NCGR_PEP_ID=MMETSP1443-20131203/63314_1 /TAXON_ID=186043 /ORGANISM="Entomoneis sp., Strain CCMP2396" /LENGTH=93 /DNA_ID=CAMNT_0043819525 /DNA_START=135 /DNA_END=416 /DNA_ORIENTATION=-